MNNDGTPNNDQPPHYQYNQPQQPYPQGFPGYPQQQQPPKKKRWPLIIGIIVGALVLCGLCGGIGSMMSHGGTSTATTSDTTSATTTSSSNTGSAPTTAPAKSLTWKTVKTFKGTGSEKTDTFTVPDTWKLTWTCDPASFQNTQYNVIALVDDASGTMVDSGVNAICKPGTTSGSTDVTSGGTVRLDITSEGDWTFNIQTQQ
jgi:hypothetical protein